MKLRDYLAEAGLSQGAFARRIRLTPPSVSRLVNGLQRPSIDTILAIQRETGGAVTIHDFTKGAARSGE
jgi:transcriptional regulator with XRE-family HTH domain